MVVGMTLMYLGLKKFSNSIGLSGWITRREWYKVRVAKKRKRILGTLTDEEVNNISQYRALQGLLEGCKKYNEELKFESENNREQISILEQSAAGSKAAASNYRIQLERVNGRITELEQQLFRVTSEIESYKGHIIRLNNASSFAGTKIGDLEAKLAEREATNASLAEQLKNLGRLYKEKMLLLATTRMGMGEDPIHFNCPEAAGVSARRNKELMTELGQLSDEVVRVKLELTNANSRSYESLFDRLEARGKIGHNFSLLYADNQFKITRVSENFESLFESKRESVKDKSVVLLRKKLLSKESGRKLIEDWKTNNDKYRKVKVDGRDIDIMIQGAIDRDGNPVGAFIYLSKHSYLQHHRSYSGVYEAIEFYSENVV